MAQVHRSSLLPSCERAGEPGGRLRGGPGDIPGDRLGGGPGDRLGDGALLVVMGTVAPAAMTELAVELAPRGVRPVDAPVSGGDVGAIDATLSIMVGGNAGDVAERACFRCSRHHDYSPRAAGVGADRQGRQSDCGGRNIGSTWRGIDAGASRWARSRAASERIGRRASREPGPRREGQQFAIA